MFTPAFRCLFTRLQSTSSCSRLLPSSPLLPSTRAAAAIATTPAPFQRTTMCRPMHTTAPRDAKGPKFTGHAKGISRGPRDGKTKGKKKGKGKGEGPDPRILNLKISMPRAVPAPLRFARNRALRHWTIHRAWLLYLRKEKEREAHELERYVELYLAEQGDGERAVHTNDTHRMYQSMHNACEELRKTSGPGTRDEGYLFRVAMEKKGVYGHHGIPIEYARPLTETPAREPWNHDWKR
ncbi:hypothetical protein F4804DRAFT_305043 [Jackrogersella minutella]|nr:hypothetical protein F4804DRAFT_305043 [Jackrogersella minutella]